MREREKDNLQPNFVLGYLKAGLIAEKKVMLITYHRELSKAHSGIIICVVKILLKHH